MRGERGSRHCGRSIPGGGAGVSGFAVRSPDGASTVGHRYRRARPRSHLELFIGEIGVMGIGFELKDVIGASLVIDDHPIHMESLPGLAASRHER